MIIVELPYVSEFLKETIERNNFKLLHTNISIEIFKGRSPNFASENDVIELFSNGIQQKIYTNSENAINWIVNNLMFTDLPRQINLFKNKVKFRKFLATRYPDFFYKEIPFNELDKVDITSFPKSFVIKPAVGFFSMGVYMVNNHEQWKSIVREIQKEINQIKSLYPIEVFDHNIFIAEEVIEGDEFAFDAYYNGVGEPIILNIFQHPFSSGDDVSDRVYLSSDKIVLEHVESFTSWLKKIGDEARLHDFPLHVEVRVDANGNIVPIEVNPLRFGGFCTTADSTWFSYGINSYEYFMKDLIPNWEEIFKTRQDKLYSLIVLNNSTGINGVEINKFDYRKLASYLEKPLEIRQMDYNTFPLFGFVFAESRKDNYKELEYILHSNLKEFIELAQP